jgi:hypothetical protein
MDVKIKVVLQEITEFIEIHTNGVSPKLLLPCLFQLMYI